MDRKIVNFYQNLYSSGRFGPKFEGIFFPTLAVDKAKYLEKSFDEIRSVMEVMLGDRAPRPLGFSCIILSILLE